MNNNKGKNVLFLCKCASNISNQIDFAEIKQWLKEGQGIDVCVTCNLLCSPKEKELFIRALKKFNPVKSIVIAGCSPKQHEKTFQELAESIGINMSKVQFANIREHCAYVTKDKAAATEKAKQIINAAIRRSAKAEDLTRTTMKVNTDIVIIGGGIAGIEAALTLSKAGRKVFIIEKNISLGGAVIQSEEIAPSMDCAPCLLAPVLSEIRDDKNIEVITNAHVEEVLGFFGNFTVKVEKKARFVKENCMGCEECFEVCPETIPNDFHLGLGDRKAIYTLFAGSVPQAAVIDKEHCRHFTDGSCNACTEVCPFQSIDFSQTDEHLEISAGAVIIATGFSTIDKSRLSYLGYGKIENIYTTPQFERLASSNGPTEGIITLKDGSAPACIAVIHCAGSMNQDGIPYCSGLCCMNACKTGEFARNAYPEARICNIHKDLVFQGPEEYDFYMKQKNEGTEFIYCSDPASIHVTKNEETGKIRIEYDDDVLDDVDMVVLATGLLPSKSTTELAAMFHYDLTKHGFPMPDHGLLNKTGTVIEGVYMAGCTVRPANIPDSINQARAAAGEIISRLIPGKEIELEVLTAYIDPDKCAGCRLCISVCPFKAITFDSEKKISIVHEAICRGCGTCAAACASGAAHAKHFTDEQILAEIGGMLESCL